MVVVVVLVVVAIGLCGGDGDSVGQLVVHVVVVEIDVDRADGYIYYLAQKKRSTLSTNVFCLKY